MIISAGVLNFWNQAISVNVCRWSFRKPVANTQILKNAWFISFSQRHWKSACSWMRLSAVFTLPRTRIPLADKFRECPSAAEYIHVSPSKVCSVVNLFHALSAVCRPPGVNRRRSSPPGCMCACHWRADSLADLCAQVFRKLFCTAKVTQRVAAALCLLHKTIVTYARTLRCIYVLRRTDRNALRNVERHSRILNFVNIKVRLHHMYKVTVQNLCF